METSTDSVLSTGHRAQSLSMTLRRARQAQRLSQLELSLRLEVSQRHISYVESARAKPSRELLTAWLHELALPLAQRNAAMLLAGFAPIYSETRLDDLDEIGPKFLAHMKDEAALHAELRPKVDKFAALLEERLGSRSILPINPKMTTPILTSRFDTPFGELAFFSMFTTFGRPQDITLASLVIEHLFAADESTGRILSSQVICGT